MKPSIETYQLHAYLDGELCEKESAEVEAELLLNRKLNSQFQDLQMLKAKIHLAYSEHIPKPPVSNSGPLNEVNKTGWSLPKTAVASLLLGLLIGAGALKVYEANQATSPLNVERVAAINSDNYLVHIDSDSPKKQYLAIKEVENLLKNSAKNVKVDLISNSKGIELFDVNNPNSKELNRLLNKYDNLTLFACKRALENARLLGRSITVLPRVKHDKPAIDAVVERLNLGWNYIKI